MHANQRITVSMTATSRSMISCKNIGFPRLGTNVKWVAVHGTVRMGTVEAILGYTSLGNRREDVGETMFIQ